ncbi:MAG TPA: hypothetical protein VKX40_09950 [Aequorivita sp.]|nr:hypothetical protein [Aequorivita sp.]
MKTQNTQNRKRKLVIKLILGFIIGISFGFGLGKLVKVNLKSTASIEKSIQQTSFQTIGEKELGKIKIGEVL